MGKHTKRVHGILIMCSHDYRANIHIYIVKQFILKMSLRAKEKKFVKYLRKLDKFSPHLIMR